MASKRGRLVSSMMLSLCYGWYPISRFHEAGRAREGIIAWECMRWPINYLKVRIDQLPESLLAVHRPRTASFAAASKSSTKRALRVWGNSADQLPVCSPGRPSIDARQTPFHPVACFSAVQVPRMTVAPPPSMSVHAPLAALLLEFGATLQVPLNVLPSPVRAAHVDEPDSFSLKASFAWLLTTTSDPRTQPMTPCFVRTMYQMPLPTDSAIGKSASPFSKVAMRSVSSSCCAYKATPDSRAVNGGDESAP